MKKYKCRKNDESQIPNFAGLRHSSFDICSSFEVRHLPQGRLMIHASLSRREILKTTSCGFGYLALAGLFAQTARAATAEHPLAAKKPHFTPRAKRVIFMFMQGGPSHVDTFDYKPALERDDGKTPTEVAGKGNRKLMKSPWKFSPAGQSGLMISELFPHLATQADDLCLLNGMVTDLPNHPQAAVQ